MESVQHPAPIFEVPGGFYEGSCFFAPRKLAWMDKTDLGFEPAISTQQKKKKKKKTAASRRSSRA